MIAVFGEAVAVYRENRYGLYEMKIEGRGYDMAVTIAEDGDFPLFLCGLGQDVVGSTITEDLVEKKLLFDSDMALMPIESAVGIVRRDGRRLDFVKHSAAMSVSGELLNLALSMHSDICAVLLSAPTLSYNPTASSFLDGASFLSPSPLLYLDAVVDDQTSVFKRMGTEAATVSDVVRVDEDHQDLFEKVKDVLIVTGDTRIRVFRNGTRIGEISGYEGIGKDGRFSAHFLRALEKAGCLVAGDRGPISDDALMKAVQKAAKATRPLK